MSLLVIGSVAFDSVETPTGSVEEVLGGSATFFSLAASYFTPVRLVAVVGDDFRDSDIAMLAEHGVDLEGLQRSPGRTFRWGGRYHENMNMRDTLFTELGVFEHFRPRIPEAYQGSDFVFLGNIDPELQIEVLDQIREPTLVACDTMNFWIDGKPEAVRRVIERVDVLTINDGEARALAGQSNLVKAAHAVQAMGPRWLIVKSGEYGARLFTRDSVFAIPAFPLAEVKDPTGAGDSFAGGFMGFLAQEGEVNEERVRQAMVMGSVLASHSVEDFSVERLRSLSYEQIAERYERFVALTRFAPLN